MAKKHPDEARCALLWRKLLAAAAKDDPVAVELMGELGRATVCIPEHTSQDRYSIAKSHYEPYRSDPIQLGSHWSMLFEIIGRYYGEGDTGEEKVVAYCNAKAVLEFLADREATLAARVTMADRVTLNAECVPHCSDSLYGRTRPLVSGRARMSK